MTTYTNFTVETDADGIALVTWDMPGKSMNVFTSEVLEELNAIIDQTVADSAIKGVVITSGKSSFSGGADLSMIKAMFTFYQDEKAKSPDTAAQKLFDLVGRMTGLFRKLETSRQAMGLRHQRHLHGRRAWKCRSPATAASRRMPRASRSRSPRSRSASSPAPAAPSALHAAADAQSALQMMTTGQSLTAARAKAMNLVHQVVEPAS
jgi:3-hydroxyacyl-CoA dehydrogenase/enoyl-CoA hydratase/3-hydroxybutyryl-CoA epimerase